MILQELRHAVHQLAGRFVRFRRSRGACSGRQIASVRRCLLWNCPGHGLVCHRHWLWVPPAGTNPPMSSIRLGQAGTAVSQAVSLASSQRCRGARQAMRDISMLAQCGRERHHCDHTMSAFDEKPDDDGRIVALRKPAMPRFGIPRREFDEQDNNVLKVNWRRGSAARVAASLGRMDHGLDCLFDHLRDTERLPKLRRFPCDPGAADRPAHRIDAVWISCGLGIPRFQARIATIRPARSSCVLAERLLQCISEQQCSGYELSAAEFGEGGRLLQETQIGQSLPTAIKNAAS